MKGSVGAAIDSDPISPVESCWASSFFMLSCFI